MVKRISPLVAGAGLLLALAAVVAGLLDPDPYLDPAQLTLSEYVALDHGGSTRVALLGLGVAGLALLAGLRARRAPVHGWPERLILIWAAGVALLAVVPVKGLEVVAFVALPVAAAQLAGRFAGEERWRAVARPMEWLALAAGLGVAVLTYVALPGEGVLIGLVERGLLGIEMAVLALLTWCQMPVTVTSLAIRNMSLTRSK
ncbi:DUF998 domain-containing protein [Acrocarpospora catenulata]|uniref:DUF998 domain-containing protein n=1 Tax=Acrocarpospora catenulata TaxID=2836182 RepID=UPI001BD91818|nr:DUF998 domain-containing protein [Acrocarpospora catenulata]